MKRLFLGCGLLFLAAWFLMSQTFVRYGDNVPVLQAADAKSDNAALKSQVKMLQTSIQQGQALVANMQTQIAQQNMQIANLKANGDAQKMKNATYVHTVILKLKSDSDSTEGQKMLDDLPSLNKISTVRGLWFGPPADKATPDVANKDFTVGITVLFDDYDGLKKYLERSSA